MMRAAFRDALIVPIWVKYSFRYDPEKYPEPDSGGKAFAITEPDRADGFPVARAGAGEA
jgi:hypothetical protein